MRGQTFSYHESVLNNYQRRDHLPVEEKIECDSQHAYPTTHHITDDSIRGYLRDLAGEESDQIETRGETQ